MPWQGDLFIGQPVKDANGALAIYETLGIPSPQSQQFGDTVIEPDVFDGKGKAFKITFRGRELRVYVYAMQDSETCERAVAFNLTGRYEGKVLDIDCKYPEGEYRGGEPSGRPDPFVFDPKDLVEVLEQVRAWWPGASVFIWDRFH